jgi:hypothetical protein
MVDRKNAALGREDIELEQTIMAAFVVDLYKEARESFLANSESCQIKSELAFLPVCYSQGSSHPRMGPSAPGHLLYLGSTFSFISNMASQIHLPSEKRYVACVSSQMSFAELIHKF